MEYWYSIGVSSHSYIGHWQKLLWAEIGPKKNNCVVRVTAEKTLGRVGRYFFFLRWLTCWMTKNGFLAENILEFWKSGALLRVHILA